MDKRFVAAIVVIILVFVGIIALKGDKKAAAPSNSSQATHNVEGKNAKHVTLVEYGDFQCPICGQYYPVVEQVAQKYASDITFQFRNLPLNQVHQNAFAAARAGEAAALQGKFWDMYNKLYSTQTAWSDSGSAAAIFKQYAGQLGLNVNQFSSDYASSKVNDTINADIAAFNKTGEQEATPTFFLDGKKISPGPTLDAFSKAIDAEIAAKAKQ